MEGFTERYALIFWAAIVLIVYIGNYFGYKRRESRDRLLEKLVEQGQSLPPPVLAELLGSLRGRNDPNSFAFNFVLMGAGIAIALFFWAMTGGSGLFRGEPGVPNWLPAIGAFPFLVGAARLLGTLADRRPEKPEKE